MTPLAKKWIARLAYVESQHHMSEAPCGERSEHVVRRNVTEGRRLLAMAHQAASDADLDERLAAMRAHTANRQLSQVVSRVRAKR